MEYENLKIETKDKENLHGWFVKQPDSKERPTIIYFHENAGSIINYLFIIKTSDSEYPSSKIYLYFSK